LEHSGAVQIKLTAKDVWEEGTQAQGEVELLMETYPLKPIVPLFVKLFKALLESGTRWIFR